MSASPEHQAARTEPAEFLRELLEIPSRSGEERAVAEHLVGRMREMGLNACVDDAGNAVGATSGDPLHTEPGVTDIVLLGHMDVVPGVVPVRCEGDLLYGRGAVDAKGPLAVFVLAAGSCVRARVNRDRVEARPRREAESPAPNAMAPDDVAEALPAGVRLVVIGAVEEEAATSKGARAVIGRYRPSACVIGEPSGWNAVTLGYKGRLLATFRCERSMAHTAGPDASAADEAIRWWNRVLVEVSRINEQRAAEGRAGPFQSVQASVRSIDTSCDGLSERIEARAGFRLPPGIGPDVVRDVCRRAGEAAPGAQVTFTGDETAIVADRSSVLVRCFNAALRARGLRPQLVLKTGTSDMNVVAAPGAWACPILAYGAGDSSLDHTPAEHVSISEFRRSIGVLQDALTALAFELVAAPPGQANQAMEVRPGAVPACNS